MSRKKGKFGRGKTIYQFPVGDKTLSDYERQVRNTKAKLNRIKKQHDIDLTNDIYIPRLEEFESRKQFNEWKQQVESFRNRANQKYQFVKNDYGVSASKKQIRDIEKNVKEAQRLADEQIQHLEKQPFISGGEQQGTVGMQRPNKTGIYRPNDFNFNEVRSKQRLKEIEESVKEKIRKEYYDKRMERMKENFIIALSGSFNSLADPLIKKIEDTPPYDFYQIYLMFDEFDFDYFDTEGQTVEADETDVGRMMKYMKRYEKGKLDKDLWHENFN